MYMQVGINLIGRFLNGYNFRISDKFLYDNIIIVLYPLPFKHFMCVIF